MHKTNMLISSGKHADIFYFLYKLSEHVYNYF